MAYRDGRPGGEGGKEKYMIYAAIGTVCVLGALTFLELNSREITWKEFINRFVLNYSESNNAFINDLDFSLTVTFQKAWLKN